MERLWTPWRMRYVSGETRDGTCIFCAKPEDGNDVAHLVLHRSANAYAIMNLYPYNSAHIMIVPFQHAAELTDLSPDVNRDLWALVPWATRILNRVLRCDGFNIGLNLGSVAGAGVSEHLHVHVVPRWEGDANFMPILANTMVLPELLPVTYAKIRAEMELNPPSGLASDIVPQAGAIPVIPELGKVALRRADDKSIVLPKGHIEDGEAAFKTAIREVDEEMGLRAMPAGWGGVLQFESGGRKRRVAHLIVTAEPGPAFSRHFDSDTLLFTPGDAIDALTHQPARDMLHSCMPVIEELLGGVS
jgi:ATP adenylyltransferase